MKKKIINGILMVALLAATTTSFVSCKDNDEDVKTDLIAQLNKQAADLRDDYIQADKDLKAEIKNDITKPGSELQQALEQWINAKEYATEQWVKDYITGEDFLKRSEFPTELAKWLKENEDFKAVSDTLWGTDGKGGIAGQVARLTDSCEVYRDSIDQFSERIAALDKRLTAAEEAIKKLQKDFENLITSVTVNATETNILSNSMLFPGLNVQFLGAIYGESDHLIEFPDVEGAEKITIKKHQLLYNDKLAAGKVYFTVNPSNITKEKMEKVTLSLTNSQNNESIIKLGAATESKKTLSYGTRASQSQVTLWEAPATFNDEEDLKEKLGQLAPAELIDLKQVGEHVKAMVKEAKAAAQDVNRNNYSSTAKSATKEILKETAQMIADLAQTKLPALPALALKAEWTDNNVGIRNVISDYSIAATAYKPVDFFWGQGIVNEGSSISFDKIDDIAVRIVNKIKAQEPDMTKYVVTKVNKVTIADKNAILNLTITGGTGNEVITGDVTVPLSSIDGDINNIINNLNKNLDMLNGAIADVQNILNKANSAADRALSLEKRVSNFLESYLNRIITSLSNQGLYKVLQPILLFEGENGVNRMVSGATLKAGKITLLPTSVTNELLAPAFKKYIAVNGKGEILTNGDDNFKKYEITLTKGENKIVYAAVDFYGNQIVKRYTVTAE